MSDFMMNPVRDAVVMLLETPFRHWMSYNKNDLLKTGKPVPILMVLSPDKKLNLIFSRSSTKICTNNTCGCVVVIIFKNYFAGCVC